MELEREERVAEIRPGQQERSLSKIDDVGGFINNDEANGDEGVEITTSSGAEMVHCTFRENGDEGLLIFDGSSVIFLFGENVSANNGGRGIQVDTSSSLSVIGGTVSVSGNASDGIGVFGASRLLLVFATTVSIFHGGDTLLPASFSKNTMFYGKQEKDGIKTAGKVESMRSSTWAAPTVHAARFILVNSSLADMNSNWDIIKTFNRLSSNNRLPHRFESIVRSISHRHGVDPNMVWAVKSE